jgi:ABC-type transport system substrate-binding protein
VKPKSITIIVTLLMVLSLTVNPSGGWVYPAGTKDDRFELFGPRLDQLLIKMYASQDAARAGLEAGEVDILDTPLSMPWIERWGQPPFNNTTKLVESGWGFDECVLEINNNPNQYLGNPPNTSYPNPVYPNPCSVPDFRHALAHLIDRDYAVTQIKHGLAAPMYTEIPTCCLSEYLHPEIRPGGQLENLTHPFDTLEAARILDGHWPLGTDGWRYWDRNGNGVKDAGEDLKLIFYVPTYDSEKLELADVLYYLLESPPIQIHVDYRPSDRIVCNTKVVGDKAFHLYLGDRNLRCQDPDYFYDMKNIENYWHPGYCQNYAAINCSEYNDWSYRLKHAENKTEALAAALKCQEIFANESCIGAIPIYNTYVIKALRGRYTGTPGVVDPEDQYENQSWKGIVDGYWDKCSCGGDVGVNSWWTFSNAYPEGHPMGDGQHMTMRYGFSQQQLKMLNPIYADDYWEWEVLNKIYDTLLKRGPDRLEDEPWIATNWTVGTWIKPSTGENLTKIRLTLDTRVKWQDGTPLTAADVRFTLEELPSTLSARGLPWPWWYPKVKFIPNVYILDPCNVEILFDVNSIWALDWIGTIKILPKHVWKPIAETSDPTVFAPDPNMIGSGPWRLTNYIPMISVGLVANKAGSNVTTGLPGSVPITSPGYFRSCPIHVNVHVKDPPELAWRQRVYPDTMFNLSVTLHNDWVNPIPNTAGAPATGLLTVHKYVWLMYPNGTEVLLANNVMNLTYCTSYEEVFQLALGKCHHRIRVAVHIDGPQNITITKENKTITVLNPWVCQWINCTFHFWVTIKEDIAGSTYYDDIGLRTYPYKNQLPTPDCKVNIKDILIVAKDFGSTPCMPNWDPTCDIDGNNKVDIKDILMVAKKFGWAC